LQYEEQISHQNFKRVNNNNLASVFNSLNQYHKGLPYAQKALEKWASAEECIKKP
jgi:hypothetical protein